MSDYAISIPRKKKRRRRKPTSIEWAILLITFLIGLILFGSPFLIFLRDIPQHRIGMVIVETFAVLEMTFLWYIYWPISKSILYKWIIGEEE